MSSGSPATSRTRLALLLFALSLAVYLASPIRIQTDSLWTIPTAASLWREGNADLDEYGPALDRSPYGIETVQGRRMSFFPLAVSWVALPCVVLVDAVVHVARSSSLALPSSVERLAQRWERDFHDTGDIDPRGFAWVEQGIASLCTSAAVALVFVACAELASLPAAFAAALCFAFGTSAYSAASRVLWQHGPGLLFLSAALWLALRLRRETGGRAACAALGACIAGACVLRPLHALSALALAALVLRTRVAALGWIALGAAAIAVPFALHAWSLHGEPLPPYFHPWRLSARGGDFGAALLGQSFSPARGLFVYSPVLLLAWLHGAKRAALQRDDAWIAAAVLVPLAYALATAAYPHWWGGHGYGPRLSCDALPWLALLLASAVDAVRSAPRARAARALLCGALALVGVLLHARGALSIEPHHWSSMPSDVDRAPERLWDWSDPPFLR
ncbi:MAG: hypothetical protein IPN34_23815 [Planctomycetes bacterium]|nr:hypothetical protein [Planctomycetota bacterium]